MAPSSSDGEKLRVFVPNGDGIVDTAMLGKQLECIDPKWTQERLDLLFRVMDANQDGKIQFDELILWALGSDATARDLSHVPVGEKPFIDMKIVIVDSVKSKAKEELHAPEVFLVSMSKAAPLRELENLICLSLGLPRHSLTFMDEGRTLNQELTLEGNDVNLPGAAARRRGEKAQLRIAFESMFGDMHPAPKALVQHLQREDWMLEEAERIRLEEERKRKEREEQERRRKEEELRRLETVDIEFDAYIRDNIGVSAELRDELKANPTQLQEWREKKKVLVDDHYLIPESEEVCQAIKNLMGGQFQVLKVFRNQNDTLIYRYQRAKENLIQGGSIESYPSALKSACTGAPPLDFLGPYDSTVNEFPLWHGTPSAEAAGGISDTGFDTNRVTTHVWGHGFYFADNAGTSASYCRQGFSVNKKYTGIKVMFLCRLLAGRVMKMSSAPSQEQQERLVAECLGPGGCFGAKSNYHSIHGGGYAYVAAHRDQVYPAYVILYR